MFEFILAEEGLFDSPSASSDASKGALGLFRARGPSVMTMDH